MVKAILANRILGLLICAILLIRIFSLGAYPLFDTTEARYGEIARIMYETQNWVTPQIDYNIPFWGKPPLHTWLSAVSFEAFGVSEFTARLPHFLVGLIALYLTFNFVRNLFDSRTGLVAALILASTLGFIVAIGMVMTEASLLLSMALAMVSYWYCYIHRDRKLNGHLFFVALAIGMLAKGPVAIVIIGIALVLWTMVNRNLLSALKVLPWPSGLLLFLSLTLPWYVWAEQRTPGFLNYFIIGEHFSRFLESGWQGDLYGSAHDEPKGMIWPFWLAAAFPWSFVFIIVAAKQWLGDRKMPKQEASNEPFQSYLICWIVAPMVLFTFAGNVLPIYVLPGFIALAVYIAAYMNSLRWIATGSAAMGSILLVAMIGLNQGMFSKTSESELLGDSREFDQNSQLYYWNKRPFSGQFYSKGQARLISDQQELKALLIEKPKFYLAISHHDYHLLKAKLTACSAVAESTDRLLLLCSTG